jgi:phytoene dehydrogenase-like protein
VPPELDAVVVGAGPNGLAAAVEIARNGHSVLVLEAAAAPGGGVRTEELTLPGFKHDVCSAIHPMGVFSPFFRQLPLAEHGLEWIHPEVPLAHPMDDGTAVLVHRSVDETAANLDTDARAYRRLMGPLAANAEKLGTSFLGPLLKPRHPIAMARFGLLAMQSAERLVRTRFEGERARGMFAGNAAHFMLPLSSPITAAAALVYNIFAHSVGWPFARGGSQAIADALVSYLLSLGGTIECSRPVADLTDIPDSRVVLFDLSPRGIDSIAGKQLPSRYRRTLQRFRYSPGVFKIDWALDGPIPWKADGCERTACLHLGGTLEEIAASERDSSSGRHPERPWVIVAQQTLFDDSRAPAGKHTAWGYCHVPSGSTVDMTHVVEEQVERYAPGFRDLVLARSTRTAAELEAYNPNYVGGDISSGMADLRQIIARPALRWSAHTTPNPRLFICSASSPPGPGVHGMCGYFAARAALRRLR